MSDVYVMGVDMIKFGRFPDRSVPNIGAEAALMALDDAGLGIQDMQALSRNPFQSFDGHRVFDRTRNALRLLSA